MDEAHGEAPCRVCGQTVYGMTWITTECPGDAKGCPVAVPMLAVPKPDRERPIDRGPVTAAPHYDDFAIDLPTPYGPASEAEVLTWPVLTCLTCGRQHAHPPAVTATYWPTCFGCWEKSTVRSQEEE